LFFRSAGNVFRAYRRVVERLSGLDASFLYTESANQPMHVCSILELDASTMHGGYTFERFRDRLAAQVKAMPEFRVRLADNALNLDHPVWVEDPNFSVERHVHHVGVPWPGGRMEIGRICGQIAGVRLPRDRPLWEMLIIECPVDAGPLSGTPLMVMTKVHHAAADGVTGAMLLARLCSTEPDAAPPGPVECPDPVGSLRLAADGLWKFVTRPVRLGTVLPETISAVVASLRRAESGCGMAAPFAAPPTAFNAAVDDRRNVAFSKLALADVKKVKNRYQVTVNDVLMALCAGVLRKYLGARGCLPEKPLVAMVPVSVHDRSDRPGRNQVSGMFCRLETHIGDPVARLQAIAVSTKNAKEHSAALGATLLQDWAQFAGRRAMGMVMQFAAIPQLARVPVHNLIFSNVAGPQSNLYCLGARVVAMYPFGPLFHGCGLNITVMSLSGDVNVGVTSCPALVSDAWEIADGFRIELDELLHQAA
jgi:WS/DGAT/MGAT family acyltransferase